MVYLFIYLSTCFFSYLKYLFNFILFIDFFLLLFFLCLFLLFFIFCLLRASEG